MAQIDEKKYDELFPLGEIRKNALKTALDTRKFEIELYWKRATYFWAFITSAFVGYWHLITSCEYNMLTPLIALVGFCFSLGWYFVNRGSKYWQENWEDRIGELEKDIQGPLFATHSKEDDFLPLHKNHRFSVSKINTILSIIVTVVWVILFIISIFRVLDHTIDKQPCCVCCVSIMSFVFLFVVACIMFKFSHPDRSSGGFLK